MSIVFCIEDFDIKNNKEIIRFKECINKINSITSGINEKIYLDVELKKKINFHEIKDILKKYQIETLLIKELSFIINTSSNFEITIIDKALERNIDKVFKFNLRMPYERILKNLMIFFNIKGFVELDEYNKDNKIVFFTLNQLNQKYYDRKINDVKSLQKFLNEDNFIYNKSDKIEIKKKKDFVIKKDNLKINFRLFKHRFARTNYIKENILFVNEKKFKKYFETNFLKNLYNQLYFDEKKAVHIYNNFGYKLIILYVLVLIYRVLIPFKIAKILWNKIKILYKFLTNKKIKVNNSAINDSTLSKLSAIANFNIKSFLFSYIYIIKIIINKLYLNSVDRFSFKKNI